MKDEIVRHIIKADAHEYCIYLGDDGSLFRSKIYYWVIIRREGDSNDEFCPVTEGSYGDGNFSYEYELDRPTNFVGIIHANLPSEEIKEMYKERIKEIKKKPVLF